MDRKDLLCRIEDAYLRAVRLKGNAIKSGPFLLSLTSTTKLRWLNNAVVEEDSHPITGSDVKEMARAFEENDRLPRMEIFRELRPDLLEILIAEGFAIESEMPVMYCTPEMFKRQVSQEVVVQSLTPDDDPAPFMRVVDIAFEHDEPITPERIEGMRQSLRKGSQWAALATIDGQPAAVASLVVSDDVAELAGVGTLPDFRRRKAASTVSSHLVEAFFKLGDLAWLSAGDDTAKAVYEQLGFVFLGTQVNISRES